MSKTKYQQNTYMHGLIIILLQNFLIKMMPRVSFTINQYL